MEHIDWKNRICGVVSDGNGKIALYRDVDGQRVRTQADFEPFLWVTRNAVFDPAAATATPLAGADCAPLDILLSFRDTAAYDAFLKARNKILPIQKLGCDENQFLARNCCRMFGGMRFDEIKICALRVFVSDSPATEGIIYAAAFSGIGGFKLLRSDGFSTDSEKKLIAEISAEIAARDPDVIVGHEIFRRSLAALSERAKKLKIKLEWGRGGEAAKFKKSRLRLAERALGYLRCDIAGRTVADTSLMSQLYDVSVREIASYSLKDCAEHFRVSADSSRDIERAGTSLRDFSENPEKFEKDAENWLSDCLRLCEILLPTYVAQVANFPMTLQECLLRGSGAKVENLFMEKYLAAGAALPIPERTNYFEGALSESYETGIFSKVLHYDVASLYPSLLLLLNRCPKNDFLGVFIEELRRLKQYRLKYKALAKSEKNRTLADEYDARQKSFKILINSFYGYLGLDGAIFGDIPLAEEVTRKGRELLSSIIEAFRAQPECRVLEADTDGIYVQSEKYFSAPEELLSKVLHVVPDGIDLEFDGAYDSMLCYKAKNYALLAGGEIILKGSAFRNRGLEPLLRSLTAEMVKAKLSGDIGKMEETIARARQRVLAGEVQIEDLSKSEYINKPVAQYLAETAKGGMRRAPMEAAAMLNPVPEVGDKVSYYIAKGDGKRAPDWKNARPTLLFDNLHPYNPEYYAKKIDDWQKRFVDLIR